MPRALSDATVRSMPELPEVEFARGCLERWLQGRVLREVRVAPSRLLRGADARLFDACVGRAVAQVDRRGKWLRIRCEGGPGWLMHLGMTGRVVRLPVGDRPHVRASWPVEGDPPGAALIDPRGFGRLLPGLSEEIDASVEWLQLGPDAWRDC